MARDSYRIARLGKFEALPVSGGQGTTAIATTTTAARALIAPAAITSSSGKQHYVTIVADQDIYIQQGSITGTLDTANCGMLLKNTYLMVLCHYGFDYLLYKSVSTTGSIWTMHHEFA